MHFNYKNVAGDARLQPTPWPYQQPAHLWVYCVPSILILHTVLNGGPNHARTSTLQASNNLLLHACMT